MNARNNKMNSISRTTIFCISLLIMTIVFSISVHAASISKGYTLGDGYGTWSVSCTSTGGSSSIDFSSTNSALTTTLTYYYTYDTSSSSTMLSYGPGTSSGNGYASMSYSKPSGSSYTSYRSVASFTATYQGDSISFNNKSVRY